MIKISEEPTKFDFSSLLKKEEQKQIDEFKTEIVPPETIDQYDVLVPDAYVRGSKSVIAKVPKKEQKIIAEDIEKLTIDELRAYYIVICKKKPKHDSKQDKRYLVNEIIKVLNLSKK